MDTNEPPTADEHWADALSAALDHLRRAGENKQEPGWHHRRLQRDLDAGGFYDHLRTNDLVGLVLRVHLWVETCLNEVLENTLPEPHHVTERFYLSQKLKIAEALGLEMPRAFMVLNKLRNKAAHEFQWEPSDEQWRELRDSIPEGASYPDTEDTLALFTTGLMWVAFLASSISVGSGLMVPMAPRAISATEAETMESAHKEVALALLDEGLIPLGRHDDSDHEQFQRECSEIINDLAGREVGPRESLASAGVDFKEVLERYYRRHSVAVDDLVDSALGDAAEEADA